MVSGALHWCDVDCYVFMRYLGICLIIPTAHLKCGYSTSLIPYIQKKYYDLRLESSSVGLSVKALIYHVNALLHLTFATLTL